MNYINSQRIIKYYVGFPWDFFIIKDCIEFKWFIIYIYIVYIIMDYYWFLYVITTYYGLLRITIDYYYGFLFIIKHYDGLLWISMAY